MLFEIRNPRQIEGEGRRRWFADNFFDLIVWYDPRGSLEGFQLCYDKGRNERALTWRAGQGYTHERVDDGESGPLVNMTPILVPDGVFTHDAIARRFREESAEIDPEVAGFVYERLRGYRG
jgi:hypothetical protein